MDYDFVFYKLFNSFVRIYNLHILWKFMNVANDIFYFALKIHLLIHVIKSGFYCTID